MVRILVSRLAVNTSLLLNKRKVRRILLNVGAGIIGLVLSIIMVLILITNQGLFGFGASSTVITIMSAFSVLAILIDSGALKWFWRKTFFGRKDRLKAKIERDRIAQEREADWQRVSSNQALIDMHAWKRREERGEEMLG